MEALSLAERVVVDVHWAEQRVSEGARARAARHPAAYPS